MVRHDTRPEQERRRRRRLGGVALGAAVLLVTGLFQPLPLSFAPARADDHITGPLQNAVNQDASDLADALTAAGNAATALSANAQAFAAQINSIVSNASSDPSAASTALQAAAGTEATSLATTGLTQALELAAEVVAPSCSTLGTLTELLPSVGLSSLLDFILGPLAGPVGQLDGALSNAVLDYYTEAFTKLLAPITLPAGAAALQPYVSLAQDLLALLKMNWHTTYYPPNGGAPVVRDTPGLLGLPTPIDVEGKLGADVCGLTNYDTAGGTLTQTISRLPLTAAFPLDIQGQFLDNVVSVGYSTKGSAAPASFQTSTTLSGTPTAATLSGAGPTFTQMLNLTSSLGITLASAKPPASYQFASGTPGGSGGSGTQLNYTGSAPSGQFGYTLTAGSTSLGVAQTPGATSFEYCTSSKGFCSNEGTTSSTDTASMHFLANRPITVDQTDSSVTAAPPCPTDVLTPEAHLTGTSFYLGEQAAAAGHVWVDTGGQPVSGCLDTGSTTGTLPTGFEAKQRYASWTGASLVLASKPGTSVAKSGTVTCPTGTIAKVANLFDLDQYFCSFPPVPVTPTISGSPNSAGLVNAYEGTALTGVPGAWGPAAPNAPTLTYSWLSCDNNGKNCNAIANGLTYTPTAAEVTNTNTLVFAVTGTNPDNPTGRTVVSAPTAVVTLPPPPVNSAAPTITGTDAPGKTLTANPGAWTGSGLQPFQYQWNTCTTLAATSCTPGTVTTSDTDTTASNSTNYYVTVTVTATDSFHQSTSATSAPVLISALAAVQPSRSSQVVPDGQVTASAANPTTGTTYIGGAFDTIGPLVGGAGQVAGSAGTEPTSYPPSLAAMVGGGSISPDGSSGIVNAVVSDGNGGYFLGGSFTSVLGTACPSGLTHIVAGGTLDTTVPYCTASLGGTVKALDYLATGKINSSGSAVTLDALAVGGTFGLVLIDSTGTQTPVQPNGTVNAITDDGSSADFFYGGAFTKIGSMPAGNLGAVMISAAPAQGTPMTVTVGAYPGMVTCTNCAAPVVNTIAALATGTLTSLSPQILFGGTFDTVYSTDGSFAQVTGSKTTRDNVAAISEATPGSQAIGAWNPSPGGQIPGNPLPAGQITAIADVTLSSVYLAGNFTTLQDGTANKIDSGFQGLAEYGIKNGGPNASGTTSTSSPNTAWQPTVDNGQVLAMIPEPALLTKDAGVYLCGSFTSISNSQRHRLAHLPIPGTATNVVPDGWNPNAGRAVRSLARYAPSSGPVIFAGGDYQVLGGTTQLNAGELNSNGTFTSWAPNPDGPVNAVAVNGTTVYLGGSFDTAGTNALSRSNLAAINTSDGTATTWNPGISGGTSPSVSAIVLSTDGATAYVGGTFTTAAGQTRNNLAAIATGTGAATTWNPGITGGTNPTVTAIAVGGPSNLVYVGGTFTTVGTTPANNLAAIDPSGESASRTWNPGTNGPVYALALNGTTVFVGGSFSTAAGTTVSDAAGIDMTSGTVTWSPIANGVVRALAVLGPTILAGGDFTTIGTNGTGGPYAAQFDETGAATPFAPAVNGSVHSITVNTATADGNPLVGLFGSFTSSGGYATDGYGFFGG